MTADVFGAAGWTARRLGVVMEPDPGDPREALPSLDRWVMTYTGWGPLGPRIALAASADLERWERLGPVGFAFDPTLRADLNLYPNKDALVFPEPVPGPDGEPAFALLHRPMWDLGWANPAEGETPPPGLPDPRPGIWVSFAPAKEVLADPVRLTGLRDHRLVALPERPWEEAKLGGGTPPLRLGDGWLVLHLADVYYGMADARIGAFRLTMGPLSRSAGGPPRRSPGPPRSTGRR